MLIKLTYNTYNTRINSNMKIYTTLLYKIFRENGTLTVNNL